MNNQNYPVLASVVDLGTHIILVDTPKEEKHTWVVYGRNLSQGKIYIVSLEAPERGILYITVDRKVRVIDSSHTFPATLYTSLSALYPGALFQLQEEVDGTIYKIKNKIYNSTPTNYFSGEKVLTTDGKEFLGSTRIRVVNTTNQLTQYRYLSKDDLFTIRDCKVRDSWAIFRVMRNRFDDGEKKFVQYSSIYEMSTKKTDAVEYIFPQDVVVEKMRQRADTQTYGYESNYKYTPPPTLADREVEDIAVGAIGSKYPIIDEPPVCAC